MNITDAKDLKYISNSLGLDLGDNFYRQKKLCGKNKIAYRNYDQLILDSGIVSMDLHNTFFNLEPVLDVNYIDKKLLTVILSCPNFSINNPASKASVICSERNNKKITSETLALAKSEMNRNVAQNLIYCSLVCCPRDRLHILTLAIHTLASLQLLK